MLRYFDEIFCQSHLPRWCDETKISSHWSQVTGCDKLIELVQYVNIVWCILCLQKLLGPKLRCYYALPLPQHPLSVSTFLSLSPSTKPLATKFKTGPPGSNPTYFCFSPSKKKQWIDEDLFFEKSQSVMLIHQKIWHFVTADWEGVPR